jgi:lantibiotic modifying enzyme
MRTDTSRCEGAAIAIGEWETVLSDATRSRALESVLEIASALRAVDPSTADPSLGGGAAAIALFFAYLSRMDAANRFADDAVAWLDRASDALPAWHAGPGLHNGIAGVAWTSEHLARALFAHDEDADPLEDIDAALVSSLRQCQAGDGQYDLMDGWVGVGVYALERLPRPSAHALLAIVLDLCEQSAERSREGATWFLSADLLTAWQRRAFPDGRYNVGVAHGVAGVAGWLSGVVHAGVEVERARALLEGAIAWMLAQRLTDDPHADFPSMCDRRGHRVPSRNVWCYGDPGIAAVLFFAGEATNNDEWRSAAVDVMRRVASRPIAIEQHVDAPLCHGSAGLAHVFNRFYHHTGHAEFGDAARFWFDRLLSTHRQRGRGLGGYAAYRPSEGRADAWVADRGLIDGSAGIGLTLVSAIAPIEPEWDRILCLSLPAALAPAG